MQNANALKPAVLLLHCKQIDTAKEIAKYIDALIDQFYPQYHCLSYQSVVSNSHAVPSENDWSNVDFNATDNKTVFGIVLCSEIVTGYGYCVSLGDTDSTNSDSQPMLVKYSNDPQSIAQICLLCIENTIQKFNPAFTIDQETIDEIHNFTLPE